MDSAAFPAPACSAQSGCWHQALVCFFAFLSVILDLCVLGKCSTTELHPPLFVSCTESTPKKDLKKMNYGSLLVYEETLSREVMIQGRNTAMNGLSAETESSLG